MPDICWSEYLWLHQEWQLVLEQGRFLFGVDGFHPTWATCFYLSRMGMVREAGYRWGRGQFSGHQYIPYIAERGSPEYENLGHTCTGQESVLWGNLTQFFKLQHTWIGEVGNRWFVQCAGLVGALLASAPFEMFELFGT